jgi:hypothetical protein
MLPAPRIPAVLRAAEDRPGSERAAAQLRDLPAGRRAICRPGGARNGKLAEEAFPELPGVGDQEAGRAMVFGYARTKRQDIGDQTGGSMNNPRPLSEARKEPLKCSRPIQR